MAGPFAGVNLSGREAGHTPPSDPEVNNDWSSTSTPSYTFVALSGTSLPLLLDILGYETDDFLIMCEIYYIFFAQKTVSSVWVCMNGIVLSLNFSIILNRHCKSECYRLQLVVWFVISFASFDIKVVKRDLA
jgi:hypothetical protein